jgi:hypothetical protein
MAGSTIEYTGDIDSVNIEKIPTEKLEEMLNGINRIIDKYIQDRYEILSELAIRKDKNELSE